MNTVTGQKTKKKLGIIGGMGSHAGVWLLKRITELSHAQVDQEFLDILLHNNSAIPDRTRAIVHRESSPLPELERTIAIFNHSEVEVAVLACMTAHYFCEALAPKFRGKLLSAVDLVTHELRTAPEFAGLTTVGLIGSTGLLTSGLYQRALEPLGYRVLTLNGAEQEAYFMQPIYGDGGIKSRGIHAGPEVKERFGHQVTLLAGRGAQVLIGACSEVPLVMTGSGPLPFIDAFDLLARQTVHHCYSTN